MTDRPPVSADILYKLFTETSIVELKKHGVVPSSHIPHKTIGLSPTAKRIYDASTPEDQLKLLADFVKDDNIIAAQIAREYILDSDYLEKYSNSGLGFYMEYVVSYYGKCPVCNQASLRSYNSAYIPVVDVICVSKSPESVKMHDLTPRLFQIKISVGKSSYFTSDRICVGSKRFGYNSHIVNVNIHNRFKNIVVGYICINLDYNEESNTGTINHTGSYVLIPEFNKAGVTDTYYQYVTGSGCFGKNAIQWNNNVVIKHPLNTCLSITTVDTTVVFTESTMANPFNVTKKDRIVRNLFTALVVPPTPVITNSYGTRSASVRKSVVDDNIDIPLKKSRIIQAGGDYYKYIKYKLKYFNLVKT